MSEIRIVAEMRLLPGGRQELASALETLVEGSRAEKGNISYDLTEDIADPDHIFVMERWASQAAIDDHNQTPHFQDFVKLSEGKTAENRVTLLRNIS